jgi:hypothetical protein
LIGEFILLLFFFAGVTNVDWREPLSAELLFAVILAAAVTAVSFAYFTLLGNRLRRLKGETGTIELSELDTVTRALAIGSVPIMGALATLMFVRMREEVLTALGSDAQTQALVIGATLAILGIVANIVVIAVHAFDGSDEADRLDALGAAARVPLRKAHRLRQRAGGLRHRVAVLTRSAERAAASGMTAAGRQRAAAEKVIDAARAVHQGTGPVSSTAVDPNTRSEAIGYRDPAAAPRPDRRPLGLGLEHLQLPLVERSPQTSGVAASEHQSMPPTAA